MCSLSFAILKPLCLSLPFFNLYKLQLSYCLATTRAMSPLPENQGALFFVLGPAH